jgi:DNA-binding NarL/FixJ family response regulator
MVVTVGAAIPEVPEDDRQFAILVVDDHEMIHWGFRLRLSREPWVCRCLGARDGREALEMVRRYGPQIVLVDLMLGDESGVDVCEQILAVAPGTRVLLMSGSGKIAVRAARAAGACGFLPKDWPAADVLRAIHAVGLGGTLFGASPPPNRLTLTLREREILDLLAGGSTNREIARTIHLSPHTVKEHVSALYRKLDARNRTGAVQRAQRLGLLP